MVEGLAGNRGAFFIMSRHKVSERSCSIVLVKQDGSGNDIGCSYVN